MVCKGIYVQSPDQQLNAVRLKWKHTISSTALFLGDQWERSYGDLQWKKDPSAVKNPWYIIVYDNKQTACFGGENGC